MMTLVGRFLFPPSLVCLLAVLSATDTFAQTNAWRLWYRQAAVKWNEALPVGNGRLGAMVFGGVYDERIQFNEDTLWTGHPHDYANPDARQQLPVIRQLLAEGKSKEAGALAKAGFLGNPPRQKAYQPFGDLHFHFAGQGMVSNYCRDLDLDSAIARVRYEVGGVTFTREVFASRPDQAIVVHLTADQPGQISFALKMDSPHTNSRTLIEMGERGGKFPGELRLSGKVEEDGLRFASRLKVVADGGEIGAGEQAITVTGANSATVYLVAGTSFKNFQDISGNPEARCEADLKAIYKRTYASVLAAHLADYQSLFRRVDLSLGSDGGDGPTDERLKLVKASGLTNDPALAALYFQFGRYLLIASSRPGGQPANLQGLWNDRAQSAVGKQMDAEHQLRNELLARRGLQSQRMHRAAVRHD